MDDTIVEEILKKKENNKILIDMVNILNYPRDRNLAFIKNHLVGRLIPLKKNSNEAISEMNLRPIVTMS